VPLGESREKKPPWVLCLGVVGAVWVPSPSPSNQRRLLFLRRRDGRDAPSPALDSPSASASLSLASYRGSSRSEVGDSWALGVTDSCAGPLLPKPLRLRPWPCMGAARALSLPISDEPCLSRSFPLPSPSSVSHDCCRDVGACGSVLKVAERANWTLLRSRGASDSSASPVGSRERATGANGG
jgi:hypothetical protein